VDVVFAVAARELTSKTNTINCIILLHIVIAKDAPKRNDNVNRNTRFGHDTTHEVPMIFVTSIIECCMLFLILRIAFRQ